jgi:hypothetical protein
MLKRRMRNWLGFRTDLVTIVTFESLKKLVTILENSQSDAFDAISQQATMIEEIKKDIKLLVEENIELRKNLPKPTRTVRNFTEFRALAEKESLPDAV